MRHALPVLVPVILVAERLARFAAGLLMVLLVLSALSGLIVAVQTAMYGIGRSWSGCCWWSGCYVGSASCLHRLSTLRWA